MVTGMVGADGIGYTPQKQWDFIVIYSELMGFNGIL